MFFDNFQEISRVLIVGTLAYLALLAVLRASGNRTLSKMNAFDFVITVAFGSVLASTLVTKGVALTEGVAALALLVLLQYVITWLSVRSASFRRAVQTRPRLVLHDGQLLHDAMRAARVTKDDVHAALRQHGLGGLELASAVVLESNGDLSVVPCSQRGSGACLNAVLRQGEERG